MEFDCFNKNSIVWHFKIFDILKHLIQTVIRGLSKAELERGDSCVLRFQCRICLRFLGLPVVIFLIHRNAAAGFFICRSSGGPFCGKYVLLTKGLIEIIGFVSVFLWIWRVCLKSSYWAWWGKCSIAWRVQLLFASVSEKEPCNSVNICYACVRTKGRKCEEKEKKISYITIVLTRAMNGTF